MVDNSIGQTTTLLLWLLIASGVVIGVLYKNLALSTDLEFTSTRATPLPKMLRQIDPSYNYALAYMVDDEDPTKLASLYAALMSARSSIPADVPIVLFIPTPPAANNNSTRQPQLAKCQSLFKDIPHFYVHPFDTFELNCTNLKLTRMLNTLMKLALLNPEVIAPLEAVWFLDWDAVVVGDMTDTLKSLLEEGATFAASPSGADLCYADDKYQNFNSGSFFLRPTPLLWAKFQAFISDGPIDCYVGDQTVMNTLFEQNDINMRCLERVHNCQQIRDSPESKLPPCMPLDRCVEKSKDGLKLLHFSGDYKLVSYADTISEHDMKVCAMEEAAARIKYYYEFRRVALYKKHYREALAHLQEMAHQ